MQLLAKRTLKCHCTRNTCIAGRLIIHPSTRAAETFDIGIVGFPDYSHPSTRACQVTAATRTPIAPPSAQPVHSPQSKEGQDPPIRHVPSPEPQALKVYSLPLSEQAQHLWPWCATVTQQAPDLARQDEESDSPEACGVRSSNLRSCVAMRHLATQKVF